MTLLWEFVSEHNIDISYHSSQRLGLLRTNDRALMDIISQYHNITDQEIISINRMRGYLQVFTLADIVTGDGYKIRSNYLIGVKSDTSSK